MWVAALLLGSRVERAAPPADVHMYGGRVPFVDVTIGGSAALSFILDTGADVNILNAAALQRLGLKELGGSAVAQPGGSVQMGSVSGLELHVLGHTLPNQTFVTAPLNGLEPFVGRTIDGILGHPFLKSFVTIIDFDRERIELQDPQRFTYRGSGFSMPLRIGNTDAYVHTALTTVDGREVATDLELDTGSFDALGLNGIWVERNQLITAGQLRIPLFGVAIGGETSGFRTRIRSLNLGRTTIAEPLAAIVSTEHANSDSAVGGVLGAEVLRRFRVILDYGHSRMFLEPNRHLHDPIEYDASGLQIVTADESFSRFIVHAVMDNGPGAQAGLTNGDEILELDGRPAAQWTLERIAIRLREAKMTIPMSVLRNGLRLHLTLRLSRLI
jgi:hypothetical protein